MNASRRRLALALALALLPACRGAGRDAPLDGLVPVRVQRSDLELSVPAEGTLEALKASPIAVPRVPTGALKVKQLAPEGSLVEAGDVLVVFDDTQLNIDLTNHKASFRSASRRSDRTRLQSDIESTAIRVMRQVADLELEHADAFQIMDDSIYSKLERLENAVRRDDAEETILFAEASLLLRGEYFDIEERILGVEREQAEGKIGRVETSLGNLVLRAPIGGMVVYKKSWRGTSVDVGDTLWPGNLIMSIVDPASTALTAYVHENDAAAVDVDAAATVTVDAQPERGFQGTVTRIAEVARPVERGSPVKYTEVRIELADGGAGLKPGMKGQARILAGTLEDAVIVPRSAVRGDPEHPFVLVAGPAGPARREVALGPGDLVRVSVTSGLDGGERVLLGAAPADVAAETAPGPGESS